MKTLVTPKTQDGSDALSSRKLTPNEISVKSRQIMGRNNTADSRALPSLSEFDPKVDLAYTSLADWTSVAQVEDTLINERFSSNHSSLEPVANKGEPCETSPRSIPS
jgi:hypothetical protein